MKISRLSIGVREENTDYLNEKIQAVNFLCTLFGLLSLPFFWFTYSLIPGLAYLPVLFFLTAVAGILFNYLHLPSAARLVTSVGFLLIFAVYSSYITPDHEPLMACFLAMQVLYLLPPWILFDLEEKNMLITYVVIAILVTLFLPLLNDMFTYEVSPEVLSLFKDGWLFYVCLLTAVLGMSGALLFLEIATYRTGIKNAQLINEMSQKAETIAANERKLSISIVEIEESRKEGERRQWAANGLAHFADLLRSNHQESQKMFDSIVSNLVKFIDANQAALFLVEGEKDDRVLQLVAMYAYDRKKYMNKTVAIGEGILGQAVLERGPVFMTAIPADYVSITSGLGEAPPRSVLISPLIVNDEVYGIIELASFKTFEPHVREFILKVGESIAATISAVRINGKTKTLLEELQQQTEEMKSQEEEMRQNMEELVATQEEMQRKEQEYLQRIAHLEEEKVTQLNN